MALSTYTGDQFGTDQPKDPYAAWATNPDLTLGDMANGNLGGSGFGNLTNGAGQGKWLSGAMPTASPTIGGYGGDPTTLPGGWQPGSGIGRDKIYTPEQSAAMQKAINTPGYDYSQLLPLFGNDGQALATAVNAHSSGGAYYMRPPSAGGWGGNPVTPAGPGTAAGAGLSGQPASQFGNLAAGFDPNTPQTGGALSSMSPTAGNGGLQPPTSTDTSNPFLPPGVAAPTAAPAGTTGQTSTGPSLTEAPGNYTGGMTMADYANPMASWMTDEGLRKLKSSYAGTGNFLSGGAMRGITDYAENSARANSFQPAFQNYMADKGFNLGVDTSDRNFAADQANLDRQFNYGVDTGNRAFDYTAQTGDRSFSADMANRLAQLGLSGTTGAAGSNDTLALLLAQLAQSGGQAAGTGTIGGSNALTSAISQIIANMNQQNIVNRIFPQPVTPGG